jgi:hypothetical protein
MQGKQMRAKDIIAHSNKEIVLTTSQIITSNGPLQELSRMLFPVILSFKISTVIKRLDVITTDFYEKRQAILNELGTLDAEKNTYSFEGENEKKAQEEINLLLDQKNLVKIVPIKLAEFGDAKLEPRIMALVDWLIVE